MIRRRISENITQQEEEGQKKQTEEEAELQQHSAQHMIERAMEEVRSTPSTPKEMRELKRVQLDTDTRGTSTPTCQRVGVCPKKQKLGHNL